MTKIIGSWMNECINEEVIEQRDKKEIDECWAEQMSKQANDINN